jgi:RecJ-like exonuclease
MTHEPSPEMAPGDEAPAQEPSAGEDSCPDCGGSGEVQGAPCPTCEGTGRIVRAVGGG